MPTVDEELDRKIEKAQAAFLRAHRAEPGTRARWMNAVAQSMDTHAVDLVPIAQAETHLAEARLRGELTRSIFQLRLFAQEVLSGETLDAVIDHADPSWRVGPVPTSAA